MGKIDLKKLFILAIESRASDIHLRAGTPPILRIDGKLHQMLPTGISVLSAEDTKAIAEELMTPRQRVEFERRQECDLAVDVGEEGRFRVNIFQQRGTISLVFRYIPKQVPSFEDLNLPPVLKTFCEYSRGLVLVTGPTGCGKSTTLASMIDYINSNFNVHIVTIEDPIEYVYENKKAIISQRELGIDTLSYAEALRHIVRQDPNVILLGEMRDVETISSALIAAQTGHLVLSTIHTIDAVQTINRIIGFFPPHEQNQIKSLLADTLIGVVSQRLLLRKDRPGRIPAVEVLVVTPHIRKLIEENNTQEIVAAMKQGKYYGMQTFTQALAELCKKDLVDVEEAIKIAPNPEELMLILRGIESSDTGEMYIKL